MKTEHKPEHKKEYGVFPPLLESMAPNHNPIIGATQLETIESVHQVLELLEEIPLRAEQCRLTLSESKTWGLVMVMQCLNRALKFEIDCRPDAGAALAESLAKKVLETERC